MDGFWATPTGQRTLLWLATLLYGAQHSLLASLRLKRALAHRAGEQGLQVYRLFYNAWAGISFLPLLLWAARIPDRVLYALPWPWAAAALAVQGLGVYMILDGLWRIGPAGFLGLAPERPHLTCRGVYAWVRHPLYVGGLLILWATPRLTVNMAVLNAGLSLYLFVGAWWEERKLLATLGPAYAAYRRAVPMWLPRPPRGPLPCASHRHDTPGADQFPQATRAGSARDALP